MSKKQLNDYEIKRHDKKTYSIYDVIFRTKATAFFTAPNKKAIEDAMLEVVDGPHSSNDTPFSKIKFGEKIEFIVGTVVKFTGTPVNVGGVSPFNHLEVKINKEVTLYLWIGLFDRIPIELV